MQLHKTHLRQYVGLKIFLQSGFPARPTNRALQARSEYFVEQATLNVACKLSGRVSPESVNC